MFALTSDNGKKQNSH